LLATPARSQDFSFGSPLIDAADREDVMTIRDLIEIRYPINLQGAFGTTALMRASFRGNIDVVRELLEAGADPDVQDIGGTTALHIAAREGHSEVLKLLLSRSYLNDIPDLEGYTPAMRAVMNEKPKALKPLLERKVNVVKNNNSGESVLTLANNSKNEVIKEAVAEALEPKVKEEPIIEISVPKLSAIKEKFDIDNIIDPILNFFDQLPTSQGGLIKADIDASFDKTIRDRATISATYIEPVEETEIRISEAVKLPDDFAENLPLINAEMTISHGYSTILKGWRDQAHLAQVMQQVVQHPSLSSYGVEVLQDSKAKPYIELNRLSTREDAFKACRIIASIEPDLICYTYKK
jgi:hypothetical protein